MTILRTGRVSTSNPTTVMATSTYRAVWSFPGSCWMLLVLGIIAAGGPLVAQTEDTITVLEDRPLLDMVLPDDTMPGEPAADGPTVLAEPEEVVARETSALS